MDANNVIVCRCEGITLKEILQGIHITGLHDIEEIKRVYRCGMGPCQGRNCERLLKQILREHLNEEEIKGIVEFTARPPLVPVNFQEIAEVQDR